MGYKRLYIFVEGDEDEYIFEKVVIPKLENKYDHIEIVTHAKKKKEKISSYIKSIKGMKSDYIYTEDINDIPCVSLKKEKIKQKIKNIDIEKIIIVIKEIEGWYLAGLNESSLKELKIKRCKLPDTDSLTKEQFKSLMPQKFDSFVDFRMEILKRFSIDTARGRNRSFKYFVNKWL